MISLKFQYLFDSIFFFFQYIYILKFSRTKNPQKDKINRILLKKIPKNIAYENLEKFSKLLKIINRIHKNFWTSKY